MKGHKDWFKAVLEFGQLYKSIRIDELVSATYVSDSAGYLKDKARDIERVGVIQWMSSLDGLSLRFLSRFLEVKREERERLDRECEEIEEMISN